MIFIEKVGFIRFILFCNKLKPRAQRGQSCVGSKCVKQQGVNGSVSETNCLLLYMCIDMIEFND